MQQTEMTNGEVTRAVRYAERETGKSGLQCAGVIFRVEEAWTEYVSYFAVRVCDSGGAYVGNVRFMSWTRDRRKSKALRMETRAEQTITTDSRDSKETEQTETAGETAETEQTDRQTDSETDSRAERERLTAESVALGIDVFSVMLRGDLTDAETETDSETESETETAETDAEESEFIQACKRLAALYNARNVSKNDGERAALALTVSRVVCFSVLRKLESAGADAPDTATESHAQTERAKSRGALMGDLRRQIYADEYANEARADYLNRLYFWDYNENGDRVRKVADGLSESEAAELCGARLSDGSELVQVAAVELFAQIAAQIERGERVDLFARFTVRELSRRVMIQETETAWRDRETCIIQECFRAVRRFISELAKQREQTAAGYSYIEREQTDSETGETATAYERLLHYGDFGGDQLRRQLANRAAVLYSADAGIVDDLAGILESLRLTVRQRQIINYRLQGRGYKAIAAALGVSRETVRAQIRGIRRKARAAGYSAKVETETERAPRAKYRAATIYDNFYRIEYADGRTEARKFESGKAAVIYANEHAARVYKVAPRNVQVLA